MRKDYIKEFLEEAVKLYFETGSSRYAVNKAIEKFKGKDHSAPDQSMQNDPNKIMFKDILPLEADVGNEELCDKFTKETTK